LQPRETPRNPAALGRSINRLDQASTTTITTHFFLSSSFKFGHREVTSMIPLLDFSGGNPIIQALDSIKSSNKEYGVSAESQRLIQNLHALQVIYQCLEHLESTGLNDSHMKAVQMEADKSMNLLNELLRNSGNRDELLEPIALAATKSMERLSRLQSDVNSNIGKMDLSAATDVEALMYASFDSYFTKCSLINEYQEFSVTPPNTSNISVQEHRQESSLCQTYPHN
jgi:hypothetical protein